MSENNLTNFSIIHKSVPKNNYSVFKVDNTNIQNPNKNLTQSDKLFMWDNLESNNIETIKKINDMITTPEQLKLNIIYSVLDLGCDFPIKSSDDLIKLFNFVSPLNHEFRLGSKSFNYKIQSNKLYLQNSISKMDSTDIFYSKYINKLKNILNNSGVKYFYFEFRSKRFVKTKDIIFVFELDQFI